MVRKRGILFILLIAIIFYISVVDADPIPITGCINISSPGSYVLANSITDQYLSVPAEGGHICIYINVSDVEFDCQNNWIDGIDYYDKYGKNGTVGIMAEGRDPSLFPYLENPLITNISIKNCIVTDWGTGITYGYAQNSSIKSVKTKSNKGSGIFLYKTSNNILSIITASDNLYYGVSIFKSNYSTLSEITALHNSWNGINFDGSYYNILINSDASYNENSGIRIYKGVGQGERFNFNQIINTAIRNNGHYGIEISYSGSNSIQGCTIADNSINGWQDCGGFGGCTSYTGSNIALSSAFPDSPDPAAISRYNKFWNNIINNTNGKEMNFKTFGANYANYFNTSLTIGTNIIGGNWIAGNYWNDYNGSDINGDGIGDSPHIINLSYIDYSPLVLATAHFEKVTTDTDNPNVSLVHPLNESELTTSQVFFTYNVTDSGNIENCSLYIDGLLNKTDYNINYSIEKNTNQTFSVALNYGIYKWHVKCADEAGNLGQAPSWQINVTVPQANNTEIINVSVPTTPPANEGEGSAVTPPAASGESNPVVPSDTGSASEVKKEVKQGVVERTLEKIRSDFLNMLVALFIFLVVILVIAVYLKRFIELYIGATSRKI